MSEPTVFLVVRGGFTPRFLLRTDIVPAMRAAGLRVVALVPNPDEPYLRAELAAQGVDVERLEVAACDAHLARSWIERTLRLLRLQVLSDRGDLTTIRQMEAINVERARGAGLRGRLTMAVLGLLTRAARRSRLLRTLLVEAESRCFAPSFHAELFERYRPRLVVVTSLGWADSGVDPYLMREARRAGSRVVGIVLSWDNTSSKGLRGGPVDHVIAWTETMKQELVDYHDLDPAMISVGGPAHFDVYYRPPRMSRAELFALHGLDPGRLLLTLGTKSPTNYPWNDDLVEMIARAIAKGELVRDCQLLVRIHPIHYRRRGDRLIFQDVLDRYAELQQRYAHVHFDHPEIVSTRLALDMPAREMDKLVATLVNSSVLINIFSTLNLEASIVDTPIVNVAFNGYGERPTNVRQDVALDEAQPHNQRIVRSGGVAMVRSEAELIDAINAYLQDPGLHREGRRRIRERECGPHGGNTGRAIGEILARLARA